MKEDLYEQSRRTKGYGFPDYEEDFFKKRMEADEQYKLDNSRRKDAEAPCQVGGGKLCVRPIVIEGVEEYVKQVTELRQDFFNPVMYRGHANANYLMLPSVLRGNADREHLMYAEFRRRFPGELNHCSNAVEQLAFMQHYRLWTRILDISENPLIGLFFACADDKRFRRDTVGNRYRWGEVLLFQAPRQENAAEGSVPDYGDDIKYFDSSTVSVIANTAMLSKNFNLQRLEIEFKKDVHATSLDEFIYLRDILRRSVIVRVKQDNPRLKNQQGAFILVNANRIVAIHDNGDDSQQNTVSPDELMDFALGDSEDAEELNLYRLKHGLCKRYPTEFRNTKSFDFCFEKIEPYSADNKEAWARDDPFDIRRLLYKDDDGNQVVFLIPPTAKENIKRQLACLGITDAFIYPEMDSVSNELCERFSGGLK